MCPRRAPSVAQRWRFDGFDETDAGSWSPPAFGRDVNGRALVFFGSSSPDNAVYALDANTGVKAWRFQSDFVFDGDVGSGPTVLRLGRELDVWCFRRLHTSVLRFIHKT